MYKHWLDNSEGWANRQTFYSKSWINQSVLIITRHCLNTWKITTNSRSIIQHILICATYILWKSFTFLLSFIKKKTLYRATLQRRHYIETCSLLTSGSYIYTRVLWNWIEIAKWMILTNFRRHTTQDKSSDTWSLSSYLWFLKKSNANTTLIDYHFKFYPEFLLLQVWYP